MTAVSVILPVYNGADFLRSAVESILTQTYSNFEMIVINNGSIDATADILASFAAYDRRLKIIRQDHTVLALALEAGRAAAQSPLLARMDADDRALPDRLEKQIAFLQMHPDVVAVGGQVNCIDRKGDIIRRGRYPISQAACRRHVAFGSPFCHPAVTMRAAAVAACGGYRDWFSAAEDIDLWLRMARLGSFANLPDVVLEYRIHSDNLTSRMALANARDAALAYLASLDPGSDFVVLPMSLEEHWLEVERRVPIALQLEARDAYIRFLTLNGGLARSDISLLFDSLGQLVTWSKQNQQERRLAFTLLRAARSLVMAGQRRKAARLLLTVVSQIPQAAMRELVSRLG
ncbi:MAG: glycosyltransferase [Beijerinckiaceae bacterium]